MASPLRTGIRRGWDRLRHTVYLHVIEPFLETHDPLQRVAWGAAIGTFVGLTPTVGIQMYLVTILWLLCRYVLRLRFNLTIGIAMVWTSNPITMVPMYYVFLKTGDLVQSLMGHEVVEMSFAVFRDEVRELGSGQNMGWLEWLLYASQVLLVEFGWPMLLGSLVYAIPLSVAAYPFTLLTLRRYREFLARAQGLTYEQWRQRYEAKH